MSKVVVSFVRHIRGILHKNSEPIIPECSFEQIVPYSDLIPVTLLDYRFDYGNMPIQELIVLCKLARQIKPRVIFEIGTFLGETTLQLAANTNATVFTLDLPPVGHPAHIPYQIQNSELDVYPDVPGIRFKGSEYESRIHQLFGNSREFDFTPYAGIADLVIVDGCHHYEFVAYDSRNALKIVSSRGTIIWHDYATYAPGVVRALNELMKEIPLIRIEKTSFVIHQKG